MTDIISKKEIDKIRYDLIDKTICSINKKIVNAAQSGNTWVVVDCPLNIAQDIQLRLQEAGYDVEVDIKSIYIVTDSIDSILMTISF